MACVSTSDVCLHHVLLVSANLAPAGPAYLYNGGSGPTVQTFCDKYTPYRLYQLLPEDMLV